MATWRLAKSLDTLRNQVNDAYPSRSKASDGTIGDASHAAGISDHNPNSAGVVTALDLTHDPTHGFDAHKLADTLVTRRHPELKYVISNRRIAGAWTSWQWRTYNGVNPHNKHIHVSVGSGNDGQSRPPYDSTQKWVIVKEVVMPDLAYKPTREDIKKAWNDLYRTDPPGEDVYKHYMARDISWLWHDFAFELRKKLDAAESGNDAQQKLEQIKQIIG